MSRCQCDEAGWCERHQMHKGERMHELCDHPDHPAYWEAWEGGYGPGQKAVGLGDRVAKAINTVTRGRLKKCGGCTSRQATLNQLGEAVFGGSAAVKVPTDPGGTERS